MEQQIDYKVRGGKLLRIEVAIEKGIITKLKLTGDFFIHPEEGITLIEQALQGVQKEEVEQELKRIIAASGMQLVGFTPHDLADALKDAGEEKPEQCPIS